MSARQGEIRSFAAGSVVTTVVVISSDAWNEHLPPLIAPVRRGRVDFPPAVLGMHESDSYGGAVYLRYLGSAATGTLGDEVLGRLSGLTMQRIRAALAEIVEG
jgi:mRNA-degrading endonuclease toxin of MazEF toxin-antitoxin module